MNSGVVEWVDGCIGGVGIRAGAWIVKERAGRNLRDILEVERRPCVKAGSVVMCCGIWQIYLVSA